MKVESVKMEKGSKKILQKGEVNKMKKFFGLLLVLGTMTGVAFAANPDSCVLTVMPSGSYSVDIATPSIPGSEISFGSLLFDAKAVVYIGSAANDGNVSCDWEMCVSSGMNNALQPVANRWVPGNVIGANNVYGLMIGTSAVGGAQPTWVPGVAGAVVSSMSFAPTQSGYTENILPVSVSGVQYGLWAKLSMPHTATDGTGTYSFTLSIFAVQHTP